MKKNIVAIVAILPFVSVLLHHYIATPPGMVPTGFINPDMPYYTAQGREIFEAGGNGWAYANAYNPGSPIIYFHWLIWLLGFGVKVLKIEPGIQFVILGLISGFLMSRLTYALVEKVLPKDDFVDFLFLLVMWGGGLLVIAAWLQNIATGQFWAYQLLRFDPADGEWFLNWGRNLIFANEAIYHLLVVGIWINLIKQKWGLATLCGLLLASTHPFSGLQFLLILIAYIIFLMITKRQRINRLYPALLISALIVFVGYYFVFLNSFKTHQDIYATWALDWILPASSALLAYSVVGIFAARSVLPRLRNLKDSDWLFIISFGISFLLANHQWFIPPHQPLHFTRGYIWTPLVLLALPEFQNIIIKITQGTKPFVTPLILTGVMIFFISDNIGFLYTIWSGTLQRDIYLTQDEREMYRWTDQEQLTGILLYPNSSISSYLAATYTNMYPYVGHWALSNKQQRELAVNAWMKEGGSPDWMNEIGYILIQKDTLPLNFEEARWNILHTEGDLVLYQRKR